MKDTVTAHDVITALRVYFAGPAFCFLEQVADGTGARTHRWADAVAMSVWPSRGYDIHGIEVKVSRYDWLKELQNPLKSAAVQQFCNYWWIATPDAQLIEQGELPPTWGWMVTKKNGSMAVVRQAKRLEPKPPSVEFIASVLRNFSKTDEAEVNRQINEAVRKAREEGTEYYRDQYARMKKVCEEFEARSGLRISEYDDGGELGEAVHTFKTLKWRVQSIGSAINACSDIKSMLEKVQTLALLNEEVKDERGSEDAAIREDRS